MPALCMRNLSSKHAQFMNANQPKSTTSLESITTRDYNTPPCTADPHIKKIYTRQDLKEGLGSGFPNSGEPKGAPFLPPPLPAPISGRRLPALPLNARSCCPPAGALGRHGGTATRPEPHRNGDTHPPTHTPTPTPTRALAAVKSDR